MKVANQIDEFLNSILLISENLMSISDDGLHLAYSLGNSIIKKRKSWILGMCCN